jgi:uroporphyrinogen-III decarboxylase
MYSMLDGIILLDAMGDLAAYQSRIDEIAGHTGRPILDRKKIGLNGLKNVLLYFFGSSREIIEFMLACDTDGILLDKECDIEKTRGLIPGTIPLFGECGGFDMLANATPAEITDKVHRCLDLGFTTVCPPADVYPPARIENIEAFVRALQGYEK